MLWTSFDLSRASAWVPQWVLAITLVLLLLQLAGELLAARSAWVQPRLQAANVWRRRAVAAAAWLSLLMLLAWILGIALGGALFCCAWLRGHAGERWVLTLGLAAGLGIALWLLFTAFLGVGLYPGVLWSYLRNL
jgi:hypothetical protein